MRHVFGILALCAVLVGSAGFAEEETLNQVISRTDLSNADSLYELAKWCSEHHLPTKANQYYNQVLKIDRDHQPTREALRQIKVGNNWISEKLAQAHGVKPAAGAAPVERQATGVGPTASEIAWDLKLPEDPTPQNQFVSSYIGSLPALTNDSREMDKAINTMLLPSNLPMALPRLCEAMLRPEFNDIYGASMLAMALIKDDKMSKAKQILPFMAVCSQRVTDAEDLCTFAHVAIMFNDRRVVPRLIELMGSVDESVRYDATAALAELTRLPEKSLTTEKAQAWWNLNYNVSNEQIYNEQLTSKDPIVAVKAAAALYEYRDKRIIPVLIKLMSSEDPQVTDQAISVLQKITGSDWSYDRYAVPEVKKKRAETLENWWKAEQDTFVWIDSGEKANEKAVDPLLKLVDDLGNVQGTTATEAEVQLAVKGEAAVPALIEGLQHQTTLIRRKCHDLLTRVAKQTFPFDASGADEQRAKEIEAWRAWAKEKKLLKEEESDDEVGEAETEE
jgi:hypothetical protein